MSGPHPEIPTRRLTSVVLIPLATGERVDITDIVTEIVESEPHDELGAVATARYTKETP